MAQNVPKSRRTSSRVTEPAERRPAPTRRDRQKFWLRIMAGLLVLAMLLPVIAAFL